MEDWPKESASEYSSWSEAKFLYKEEECRLVPGPLGTLNLVRFCNDQNMDCIDSFDPADVIGAELQINFSLDTNLYENVEKDFVPAPCCAKGDDHENLIVTGDTIGGSESQDEDTSLNNNMLGSATAFLNIYSYPRKASSSSKSWIPFLTTEEVKGDGLDHITAARGNRMTRHFKLEVVACEDFANARACVRAIRKLSKLGQFEDNHNHHGTTSNAVKANIHPRRYLVLLNPFSGKGTSMNTYESTIQPMLDQAGVEHDLFITKHSGHGKARVKKKAQSTFINVKQTIETNFNEQLDGQKGLERDLSLYDAVIIVGGDGSLWEILQGVNERPDREEVLKKVKFGIVPCGTCNGLAKSLLHESQENYVVLESIFLICKGKTAPLDLSIYRTRNMTYNSFLTFSWAIIADCDIESERLRYLGSLRNDIYAIWRILNLRTYSAKFSYLPPNESDRQTMPDVLPPLNESVPSNWVTIEDEFILFWASQVSHASFDLYQSPSSKLQDGLFHVFLIRKSCTRRSLIEMFLNIEAGTHLKNKNAEEFKCIAYRLEPITIGSYNDVDGEVVESGPIQACVLPDPMHIFCAVTEPDII